MANIRGKAIDNTHLSIDVAEDRGFIHRDYLAHCHRWSHVMKWLGQQHRYKDAVILDVGCGKDVPMGKMLYSSKYIPQLYIGVDYNKNLNLEPFHTGKFPIKTVTGFAFPNGVDWHGTKDDGWELVINGQHFQVPNVVVSFEVIEHVEPAHARSILSTIHDIVQNSGGDAFISTPCYSADVGAAGNHVSEITRSALGAALEDLGFSIEGNFGTFASIRDYKEALEADGHGPLFNRLRDYYDTNLLATIFAPLYPEHSRNNLWHLKAASPGYVRKFPPLKEVPGPWTSSEKWQELAG